MHNPFVRQPSYRHHKARGCAVVTIDGKNHYLGAYDSPESHEKYARLVAQSRAGQKPQGPSPIASCQEELSINGLIHVYWTFAKSYYVCEGKPTKELTCMKEAIRPLRKLFWSDIGARIWPEGAEGSSPVHG